MARVRVETQKISYRDFVPDAYLDHQTGENHENAWRQLLLERVSWRRPLLPKMSKEKSSQLRWPDRLTNQ
jgi:hypothetical protein